MYQGHEEYRQQAQPGAYHYPPLLLTAPSSTHDMNKQVQAAPSGMYPPNTGAIPGSAAQHHQPGMSGPNPSAQLVQQINPRTHMASLAASYQSRPNPQHTMPNMSRPPMANVVSQSAQQAPQQYQTHVQMLASHPQFHPINNIPPMFMHGQLAAAAQLYQRPPQYPQQQYAQQLYGSTSCYNYNTQPTNNVYYQMQMPPACPPAMNHVSQIQQQAQPKPERKILPIINPKTGKNVLEDLNSNESNDGKDNNQSGKYDSDICMMFAAQVAALATDKELIPKPIIDEKVGDPQSAIRSDNLCVIDNVDESGNGEVEMHICEQYIEEDIVTPRENSTVPFSNKDRVDLNSINDIIPIAHEIRQDSKPTQPVEVIEPPNLVNHETLNSIEEPQIYSEVLNSFEETISSAVVLTTNENTKDLKPLSYSVVENELKQDLAIEQLSPPIQAEIEVQQVSPVLDNQQNGKISEEIVTPPVTVAPLKVEKHIVEKHQSEAKKGKKGKKKDLNKKGESKEGGDMDAFLDSKSVDVVQVPTSPPTPPPTAPVSVPAAPVSVPAAPVSVPAAPVSVPAAPVSVPAAPVSVPAAPVTVPAAPVTVPTAPVSVPAAPVSVPAAPVSVPAPVQRSPLPAPIVDSEMLNSIPLPDEEKLPEQNEISAPPETPVEIVTPIVPNEEKKEKEEVPAQESAKLTLKYQYKEDQWSPLNPEGKKQYDRDFLLEMQGQPMSLRKPLNLPNLEVIRDKVQVIKMTEVVSRAAPSPVQPRSAYSDPFMPQYARGGAPRPPHTGINNRRSQQGRGGDKPKKVIAFSSSLNQAIKLHESENAWKPAQKTEADDVEENKTQELYKKVRGILNKLTPQKFQTLVGQVKSLDINTEERLNGVIDLVFEKAIDEPNFSVPYANMCKQLALLKVPSSGQEGSFANFRKLLLTKCQREFEQDSSDEIKRMERMKLIEECKTAEKKKQLLEETAVEELKNRRRQLGNIRFIGELFKLSMLIEPIMHECIKKLLSQGDEDSLECLCRLFTTIGKELDSEKEQRDKRDKDKTRDISPMDHYFNEMQKVVEKRNTSSRVRFMLQDVIELRRKHWIPRRDDNNPKTIDQIHKEAQREAQEQQQMLQSMPFTNKRMPDDRDRRKGGNSGGGGGGGGGGGRNNPSYEDGWITSNKGSKGSNYSVDPMKLKLTKPAEVEHIQLGPGGRGFASWSRGSSGGTKTSAADSDNKSSVLSNSNRYSALADQSSTPNFEARRGSQRSAASSRESSRSRNSQLPPPSIRKTASTSKERENLLETVKGFARIGQPEQKPAETKVPEVQSVNGKDITVALKGPELSEEEMEKKTKPLIDEFLHNNDFEEAIRCIMELASPVTAHMFITAAINQVLERSSQTRYLLGQLLHSLVKKKIVTIEQYNKGLKSVLELVDDYALDIPLIWEYLGELIEPMIGDTLCLVFLKDALHPCIPSVTAGKLVSAILHCAAKKRGTIKVGEMWRESKMEWTDFLNHEENVPEFVESNKLEFTVCQSKLVPVPNAELSPAEMKKKLDFYLKNGTDNNEEIFDWTESHVGEDKINEPIFIRALVTAVHENAITGSGAKCELIPEKLKKRMALLTRYVAGKENLELQALYALQALINQLDQPKGVLRQIFDTLYDDDIITEETFKKWEVSNDPAEQEGKGVALLSVGSFLTWLREADDETSGEEG